MSTRQDIRLRRYGVALLRVTVGAVFLAHGAQKLFVWGVGGVTESFAGLGVPAPALAAVFATAAELLGGAALVLGLYTRVAAVPLAITMLGALVTVHLGAGFFLPNGYEFVLTLLAGSVAVALSGPGALSLDARLRRDGPATPVTAVREDEAIRAEAA